MDDLINRQDAINLLKKWADGYKYIEIETESAIKEFKYLPSAQPEPVRRGRWIQKSKPADFCTYWWYECSACGDKPPNDRYGRPNYLSPYCPNCGARMEEQE